MSDPYVPIDCGFHDVLESLAVTRQPANILIQNESGERTLTTRILDVYVKDRVEYLKVEAEPEPIRLDHLVAVTPVEAS